MLLTSSFMSSLSILTTKCYLWLLSKQYINTFVLHLYCRYQISSIKSSFQIFKKVGLILDKILKWTKFLQMNSRFGSLEVLINSFFLQDFDLILCPTLNITVVTILDFEFKHLTSFLTTLILDEIFYRV